MRRKILYISGTRADYGLMRSVLLEIHNSDSLDLEIIVTGMHLMDEFGMTINEIIKDGFDYQVLNAIFEDDNKYSMAKFVGKTICILTDKIKDINPDLILLLGDRGEMLAGAIVGAYLNIPVAHFHGGDISSTVDEYNRHAITKLANIHLPATQKSANRIITMGENPEHVFVVGAPGIESILNKKLIPPEIIANKYEINLKEPLLLVVQHPVTIEFENAKNQIKITLDAISDLKLQTIIIYPNADAGGREIIDYLNTYGNHPFISIFKHIPRKEYLSLMSIASAIIGNSSSGIIEAPSFNLPAVNIGSRQDGRERAKNVLDVDYDEDQIENAIKKAIYDKDFKFLIENDSSPYGDGKTAYKVVKILQEIVLDERILNKKWSGNK